MTKYFLRAASFWLMLAGLGATSAHALTIPQLQRLLQSGARPTVNFQELRESPWLSAPVTSRGTMRSTPGSLEKRIESPRQETWRLLPDRIEWVGAAGNGTKQILFSQAPALAALSDVMRRVVAGEIVALERDFRIELTGDERAWRANLQPHSAQVKRHLDHVELQGTAGQLQIIIVVERQGERTTTRFNP
jgi:hypothetical protein